MFVDFDATFHKKPYPEHLASNCPCNTCEYNHYPFLVIDEKCDHCAKYRVWLTDCICKLGEMERKYEV